MGRFSVLAILLIASASVAGEHESPTQWQEGVQYQRVEPPVPTVVGSGRIEVTEYFWYGCPHCNALEPYLVSWLKQKPGDVTFVRIPVAWDKPERIAHARLFFALQRLGRMDLHDVVFETIHVKRNHLFIAGDDKATLKAQVEFAEAHGIAGKDFEAAYADSSDDVTRANARAEASHIAGVPSILVGGKYVTDPGKTGGSQENLIAVINGLVDLERKQSVAA